MSADSSPQLSKDAAGWLIGAAVLLTLATGAIHAWIGLDFLLTGLTTSALLFLGMSAPYFAGVLLYVAGITRRWVLRVAPLYVAALLVLWLIEGMRDPLAYLDKVIEVALLGVLGALLYFDHRQRLAQFD